MRSKFYYWGPLLVKYEVTQDIVDEFLIEGDRLTIAEHDHSANLAGEIEEEKRYTDEFTISMAQKLSPYFDDYFRLLCREWKVIDKTFYWYPANMWINYQRKGESNPVHTHNGDLSFVLYVDIPEEIGNEKSKSSNRLPGGIYFEWGDNKATLESDEVTSAVEAIDQVRHKPKTGELFIFPATLKHYVLPFYSDVIRKSVSGNIYIKRDSDG